MDDIVKKINDLGIKHYGFIDFKRLDESYDFFKYRKDKGLDSSFEEESVENRINFKNIMEDGKTIMSFAFPYSYSVENPKGEYFSLYALGEDYHIILRDYLEEIAVLIRNKGYKAEVFVDNNQLPERYLAYIAGLGEIGRNSMLITETYGSYVFLGEIITNYHLDSTERKKIRVEDYIICGDCNLCVKACPASILGKGLYDTKKCLSFLSQKKDLDKKEMIMLKGRLFGCDTCQIVCPLNKGKKESYIERFRPKDYMLNPDARDLLCLTNKDFRKYRDTSAGWRGKKLLQRNALVEIKRRNLNYDKKCINTEYLEKYENLLDEIYKRDL